MKKAGGKRLCRNGFVARLALQLKDRENLFLKTIESKSGGIF